MVFAFLGIGMYYPMSTFFFPNFQFQDKALDLKYNPSFVVLQIQAKLIITGLGTLFQSFGSDYADFPLILQSGSTCVVLCLLSIASMKLKPCLIKKMNLWDAGIYLLISYMNGCALFVVLSKNSTIGIIAITTGSTAIFLGILFMHRKLYGFNCLKFNNKVQNEADEDESENDEENKSNEDLEDNSKEAGNATMAEKETKESRKLRAKMKKAMMANPNVIVKNPEVYKF